MLILDDVLSPMVRRSDAGKVVWSGVFEHAVQQPKAAGFLFWQIVAS